MITIKVEFNEMEYNLTVNHSTMKIVVYQII
jgi:hypothetical protein